MSQLQNRAAITRWTLSPGLRALALLPSEIFALRSSGAMTSPAKKFNNSQAYLEKRKAWRESRPGYHAQKSREWREKRAAV